MSKPYQFLKPKYDGSSKNVGQDILDTLGEKLVTFISYFIEMIMKLVAPVLYEIDSTLLA